MFGAKIIRGGGAKDIPHLIDDGLAIGGAASAIGIDFPYPNFTGPATAMGLLLTQAACRIRAEGGRFTRENLRRHYLEPLQRTHYWQDVEFLRRWPGYVKRTQVFFDRNLDLALGTAYVWTRPRPLAVYQVDELAPSHPGCGRPRTHWRAIRTDLRHLTRALHLRAVMSPPSLGRLLLDGTMNALRDLARARAPTCRRPAGFACTTGRWMTGAGVPYPRAGGAGLTAFSGAGVGRTPSLHQRRYAAVREASLGEPAAAAADQRAGRVGSGCFCWLRPG